MDLEAHTRYEEAVLMKVHRIHIIVLSVMCIGISAQVRAQTSLRDSSYHPYHVNYWISGALLGVGATTNLLGMANLEKTELSMQELDVLDKNNINSLDRWSFQQDPAKRGTFENFSDITLFSSVVLPVSLILDDEIKRDWFDIFLMYLETMSLSPNIYQWSPFGPAFQNRVRPVAYYDEVAYDERKDGNNKNSLYSGHVASVASATFFMVKVYSDYHPEVGNTKYMLYAVAALPPTLLGYFRIKALKHFPSDILIGIGVGALCGILVPELHRFNDETINLGVYSSPTGTGLHFTWHPGL